jgi:hypothetical protein
MPQSANVSSEPVSPAPARLSPVVSCGENEFPAHVESRRYSGRYDYGHMGMYERELRVGRVLASAVVTR